MKKLVMNKRGFVRNKKGFELAIRTIVIIVLAILVLIAVLVIFNQQTGIFSDFLLNLMGKTNVDAIVTSCNSLVTRKAVYDYCCIEREVKYRDKANGKIKEEKLTCEKLAEKPFGGRIDELNCETAGC